MDHLFVNMDSRFNLFFYCKLTNDTLSVSSSPKSVYWSNFVDFIFFSFQYLEKLENNM